MKLITQITSDPKQKLVVLLDDGTQFELKIEFKPQQFGWFITSLVYGDVLTITGMRICVTPNLLRQFKNQISFGLACYSTASREPTLQEDFSSGAAQLFLLSEAEVQQFEDYLSGQ